MAKAIEISVYKPHSGKGKQFIEGLLKTKKEMLAAGVSEYQIIGGVAGKDVTHVLVIQTFKSLADAGAINDSLVSGRALGDWMDSNSYTDLADVVSHDLYEVLEG